MTLPPGWTVLKKTSSGLQLKDSKGRVFVVITGRTSDVKSDIQEVTNALTQSGTNVKKGQVETVDLHPDLNGAKQSAQFSMADGSGSLTLGATTIMGARKSDSIGFAATLLGKTSDFEDKQLTNDASSMMRSLVESLVA
ncbi:hypothetical protein CGZ93_03185 [Enemella dayhoffiae]|uniref:Uncharacterized protein n=1 Tax=Enemella dayhoffiae TaxID=2016507 RepID=A0A255HA15_9ACTN|nr:hypothetical protein CGZ93_03185 [Enemella dayhoffiae]